MEQTTSSSANRVVLNLLLYLSMVLMAVVLIGFVIMIREAANPKSPPIQQPTQPELWVPTSATSWQWQITGTLDTSLGVQMYMLDLFDTTPKEISQIHEEQGRVVCYFSAGTLEDWRPDRDAFPAGIVGDALPGRPSEYWLDIRQLTQLKQVMAERLDLAAAKGCDGVQPANVDGYTYDSGFPLTYQNQLAYNIWLAQQAHKQGLSIGLMNDLEQVAALLPYFDWALNEECFTYEKCGLLARFTDAGKAVFGVEYSLNPPEFCPQANEAGFNFLLKRVELDSWRQACR